MVAIALVAVAGAGIAAFVDVSSSVDFPGDDATVMPLPGVAPEDGVNVLSRDGYRDLVRAVSKATGSTDAFEAVIYPGYAVLTLPVDPTSQREDRWYWDGELDSLDSKGTSSYERLDLASDPSDGASIRVYASNEYSESAYLSAEPDGTIVHDSTKN